MPMHFFSFQFFHAAAQLHFPFFILRGIGELPNKRDLWHCIYTMNTNPLLAPFKNIKTGQIHLSGTGTKIKGIKIENIFLYKIQAQKKAYPCTHVRSG